jgi:hypothetical protein
VINLDLPLLYDKSGGGKGGKGGRGTFTGLVDEITYIHRLGRATRSETAHGLCINIVGGVEEQVDALGMLQHLKASDKLEAFGRHYDVQRDIYSDGPVSMEVMVGKNDKGIEMWETIDEVTVNRVGEDELGWTVSFMHNGQLQQDVPLNHDMVHAPFDFTALDEEMKLFNDKANIEGALIKFIRINSYDTLKDTISEARKVIDALGSRPREASEKAASASWPWREKAIEFLERLIKEAIFEAHKHSKTA